MPFRLKNNEPLMHLIMGFVVFMLAISKVLYCSYTMDLDLEFLFIFGFYNV